MAVLQHLIRSAHVLVHELHAAARLLPEIVRERIDLLPIPVERMPRLLDSYRAIFGSCGS